MPWSGYAVRIGTISYSAEDAKSWYGLHFVGFGGQSGKRAGLSQQELQPAYGFAARPVDATGEGAGLVGCNGFYSLEGDFAWLGHDPRYNDKCPTLKAGDVAFWCYKGHTIKLDTVADEIVITNSAGAKITVTGTDVTIENANLTVGGAGAKLVALAELVDTAIQNRITWETSHTHGTALGPTSPPITPPTPETSVACTKTKTE